MLIKVHLGIKQIDDPLFLASFFAGGFMLPPGPCLIHPQNCCFCNQDCMLACQRKSKSAALLGHALDLPGLFLILRRAPNFLAAAKKHALMPCGI